MGVEYQKNTKTANSVDTILVYFRVVYVGEASEPLITDNAAMGICYFSIVRMARVVAPGQFEIKSNNLHVFVYPACPVGRYYRTGVGPEDRTGAP